MAGLYIHIPFCVKKCKYCDFRSGESIALAPAYIDALLRELSSVAESRGRMRFDTVFFGGGTPSLLPLGYIERIMGEARGAFEIAADAEITVECNPGAVSEAKLEEYIGCGVNRLSVGLQSSNDAILRAIGRVHTRDDYVSTMLMAHRVGFENVSADVMVGLPEQTQLDCSEALKLASDLGATHISMYMLMLEPGTPLFDEVLGGSVKLPTADETADMQDVGAALLERLGFYRYEISNFAREGYECLHNINYWQNGEYLGLGCAAHSALRSGGTLFRRENIPTAAAYIDAVQAGEPPIERSQASSVEDERFESIMLGLRMTRGIRLAEYSARFGVDFVEANKTVVRELTDEGLMELCGGYARLTPRGLDIQNSVLLRFM